MTISKTIAFDSTQLQHRFKIWNRGYQALADEAGCSIYTVHRVVNGKAPNSKSLSRIAKILNVDLEDCWQIVPEGQTA